MTCTCGTPSLANYYVHAVISGVPEDGFPEHPETREVDAYVCDDHMDETDLPKTLGIADGWEILESEVTHLRTPPKPGKLSRQQREELGDLIYQARSSTRRQVRALDAYRSDPTEENRQVHAQTAREDSNAYHELLVYLASITDAED